MQIERNNIYNVDCLEGMRYIADASIDMIFSDLPYGMTKGKWDVIIPPAPLWEQYERIIKPNGAILLFGQDKFTAKMMLSNEKLHRYNIIWKKVHTGGFLNANRMPLREHEDIMVFYKQQPTYNPQKWIGKPSHSKGSASGKMASELPSNRVYGDFVVMPGAGTEKFPTSVWEFNRIAPSKALHSTEKPISLCRYAIRTYTNPGDTVFDSCCGAGSIPIAALMEGRKYIGMDNGVCDRAKSKYFGLPWAEVTRQRLNEVS